MYAIRSYYVSIVQPAFMFCSCGEDIIKPGFTSVFSELEKPNGYHPFSGLSAKMLLSIGALVEALKAF